MNVWDDPKNYKPARAKTYEIYMCRPKNNTVVINSLEQGMVAQKLGGRCYFTADEVVALSKTQPDKFKFIQQCVQQGMAYAVSDKTPFVLAGTLGEMWCVDGNALMRKYQLVTNQGAVAISEQTLSKRAKSGLLDWCKIRTVPNNSQVFACFSDKQRGIIQTAWGATLEVNAPTCKHGKGDFIIANRLPNGQVNMQDRWVVNGGVFAVTYDNRGWSDCLDSRVITSAENFTMDKLPKLVDTRAASEAGADTANVNLVQEYNELYLGIQDKMVGAILNRDYVYLGLFGSKNISRIEVSYEDLLPLPKLYTKVKNTTTGSGVKTMSDFVQQAHNFTDVDDLFCYAMQFCSTQLKTMVKRVSSLVEKNPSFLKNLVVTKPDEARFCFELRLVSFLADCLAGKRGEQAFIDSYMCCAWYIMSSTGHGSDHWQLGAGTTLSVVAKQLSSTDVKSGGVLRITAPLLSLGYATDTDDYIFTGAFTDPTADYFYAKVPLKGIFGTDENLVALDKKLCSVLRKSSTALVHEYKYTYIETLKQLLYYQQYTVKDLVRAADANNPDHKQVMGVVLTKSADEARGLTDSSDKKLVDDTAFQVAVLVKVEGSTLVVTAKHKGKVVKIGNIRVDFAHGTQIMNDTYKVYLSLCNTLNISPFQFILSNRFINAFINKAVEMGDRTKRGFRITGKKGTLGSISTKVAKVNTDSKEMLPRNFKLDPDAEIFKMSRSFDIRVFKHTKLLTESTLTLNVTHLNKLELNRFVDKEGTMLGTVMVTLYFKDKSGNNECLYKEKVPLNAAGLILILAFKLASKVSRTYFPVEELPEN